jgi:hypothetical protein
VQGLGGAHPATHRRAASSRGVGVHPWPACTQRCAGQVMQPRRRRCKAAAAPGRPRRGARRGSPASMAVGGGRRWGLWFTIVGLRVLLIGLLVGYSFIASYLSEDI